jgi:hypothetical protein
MTVKAHNHPVIGRNGRFGNPRLRPKWLRAVDAFDTRRPDGTAMRRFAAEAEEYAAREYPTR